MTSAAHSVDPAIETVMLDGTVLTGRRCRHIMLNKPSGYITATEDMRAPTVMDLLEPHLRGAGLGPIGRLDKDVTGLVLLTTDGQLAHRLISPRRDHEKVYIAKVEGCVGSDAVRMFAGGMAFADFTAKSAALEIIDAGATSSCRVTLTEGKYHQVKRMFQAIGHPIITLERVSIAGVALDTLLAPGAYRDLNDAEAETLYRAAGI